MHVCADTPLRRVDFANMFVSFYGSFLLFDDSPGLHLHFMAFHRPTALTTHKVSLPSASPVPPHPLFPSALPTPCHLPSASSHSRRWLLAQGVELPAWPAWLCSLADDSAHKLPLCMLRGGQPPLHSPTAPSPALYAQSGVRRIRHRVGLTAAHEPAAAALACVGAECLHWLIPYTVAGQSVTELGTHTHTWNTLCKGYQNK